MAPTLQMLLKKIPKSPTESRCCPSYSAMHLFLAKKEEESNTHPSELYNIMLDDIRTDKCPRLKYLGDQLGL